MYRKSCLVLGFLFLVLISGCITFARDLANAIPSAPRTGSRYIRPANGAPYKKSVIVFVHGFLGDSDSSWRNPTGAYWPELLLTDAVFNDDDVYDAEYPASLSASMTLDDIVSNLNSRLVSDGVFSQHRNVILVCHSLGGIVAQRLLLAHRDYAKQVPFIYFFATPETGAQVAKLAGLFSNDPILQTLLPGDRNQQLQGLENDWKGAEFAVRRYCAYETREYKGVLVVDRLSATRNCDDSVALDKDHVSIVKPSGRDDESYVALKNAIRRQLSERQISDAAKEIREKPFSIDEILEQLTKDSGTRPPDVATQIEQWASSQADPWSSKCLPLLVRGRSIEAGKCYKSILPEQRRQYADSLQLPAWSDYVEGSYADAEKQLDQALTAEPEDLDLLNADAVVLTLEGKHGEALGRYEQALALEAKAGEPSGPVPANTLANFAVLHQALGHCQQAELFDDWALLVHRRSVGPQAPELATEFNTLAVLYSSYGLFGDAESYAEHSWNLWEKIALPSDVVRRGKIHLLTNRADLYVLMRRYDDAREKYRQALELIGKSSEFDFPEKARVLIGLANLYFEEGGSDQAGFYAGTAHDIDKTLPESPENAATLAILARIAYKKQKYEDAAGLSQQAAALIMESPGSGYRLATTVFDVLTRSLHSLNKDVEATQLEKGFADVSAEREKSGCEILAVRQIQN